MSEKTMMIIGAGIAGLSTGCYGRMNGYRTSIFEMHDKPGGLCTAWSRSGYIFDGCIHHLAGASPASRYYTIWEELGAADVEMAFHEVFVRCEDASGHVFNVYTDIDRLEEHLKEIAPEDSPLIDQFIRRVHHFSHFELLALPLLRPVELLSTAHHLVSLPRWMKITTSGFAERFNNPFLRRVFRYIQYGIPDVPMGVHLGFLAGCHKHTLGTPRVDSLTFARTIEKRYGKLGGELHYHSKVEQVLIEGNRAVGVRLFDGSEHRADVVVSAADGRSTIFQLLNGKYRDEVIRTYYENPATGPQPFAVHVSLGVARDLSQEHPSIFYFFDNPLQIAGIQQDHVSVELNSGPPFAPPGKSVLKVPLDSTYADWAGLSGRSVSYQEAKTATAESVINILEQRFPGLQKQVEIVDVATPLTTERYTGNYHGMQPWKAPKGSLKVLFRGLSRTLPGLENFYMVGHWAEAMVGISTAALSGRRMVQRLCRKESRPFHTGA